MKIDIEELNNIVQDIKDDINSGARIMDCPDSPKGHVLIDIPMSGIKFKFSDILPYIEQASDRLEDMKIHLLKITVRFSVDREPLKISSEEFYDIMNNGYTRRKKGNEFFGMVTMSKELGNTIKSIDKNNNLLIPNISNILIRYEYLYDDGNINNVQKSSWIKKFKDYFK